jgi:hypothetical protein
MAPVNIAFGKTCKVTQKRKVTLPDKKTVFVNVSISYGGEDTIVGPSMKCQDSWNAFRRALKRCTLPLEQLYTIANPAQETWSSSFDYAPTRDQISVENPPTTNPDDITRFLAPFSNLNLTLLDYAVPLLCSTLGGCDKRTNLTAHYNNVWNHCKPNSKNPDRLSTILFNKAITLYGAISNVTCHSGAKKASDFCFPDFAENVQALQNIITPIDTFPPFGRSAELDVDKDRSDIDSEPADRFPPASWPIPTLNTTRFCGSCQSVLLQNFVSILKVTSTSPNEAQFIAGEAEGIRQYVCGGGTHGLDGVSKIRACAAGREFSLPFQR